MYIMLSGIHLFPFPKADNELKILENAWRLYYKIQPKFNTQANYDSKSVI